MDQNRLQESTMKAAKKTMELTRSAMEHTQKTLEKTQELSRFAAEKSKKLRTPSAKADRIGTAVGGIAGVGLLDVYKRQAWGWVVAGFTLRDSISFLHSAI